jgi:iron(II)-dependent oxidoreductase
MGSEEGDRDERPPHPITVKAFWIGKYEVTNAQYAAFLEATGHRRPMYWDTSGFDDPRQPVVGVLWQDAKAYCDWAKLRLPTEAEWEYAARAGKRFRYATATGAVSRDLANYRGTGGADRWDGPSPVGSFPPNPLGLYDMAGNAWEWTSTNYRAYPYSRTDGREYVHEARGVRVMRGGSWHSPPAYLTTTHRHRFASHLSYDYAGFRVARTR